MTTTYLGSGDASKHRRDYRPDWLDNLADDVTIEGSVLTGIAEGPEAIRAILGFARTLYEYQEFNYVGPYGDDGFVEDYTSVVRGEPIGSVVVIRFNEAGQDRPDRGQPPAAALGAALVPAHGRALRRHALRAVLPQPRRGGGAARGGRCCSRVKSCSDGGGLTAAEQPRRQHCGCAAELIELYRKKTR